MNFTAKCANCGRTYGLHHANDHACPVGRAGRVGITTYSRTSFFDPAPAPGKTPKFTPPAAPKPRASLEGVDLSQSVADIQAQTGCARSTIYAARKSVAEKKGRPGRPRFAFPADVDWSQTDKAIAEALNIHPRTVANNRPTALPQ